MPSGRELIRLRLARHHLPDAPAAADLDGGLVGEDEVAVEDQQEEDEEERDRPAEDRQVDDLPSHCILRAVPSSRDLSRDLHTRSQHDEGWIPSPLRRQAALGRKK